MMKLISVLWMTSEEQTQAMKMNIKQVLARLWAEQCKCANEFSDDDVFHHENE